MEPLQNLYPTLEEIMQNHQKSSDIIKNHQTSSSTIEYHELSFKNHQHQNHPNIKKTCLSFLGKPSITGDVHLLARFSLATRRL
jgi:hypothetical protein